MPLGVSSVSFCAVQPNTSAQDILNRPGAYSRPADYQPNVSQPNNPEKKSSGFGKKLLITTAAIAFVVGGLYALPKYFPKVFDAAKNLEGLKGIDKYKSYATTYIAKAGNYIGENCTKIYNRAAELLHIKKSK